ncbi:hypothetical protein [Sulfurisphaera ohwakuensis]|uniref:Uncharacterized protein n=1 Tax=Sulfurisphaera ohwakuensis TaxID=69656 RepID=A0A7J9RTP4_SULOH|nr:hypothetical protein [Sulfurisphaera ohwakuensis]MBB5254378.1 hypothetical protein [Sulfurisphaera ohwakuensis]
MAEIQQFRISFDGAFYKIVEDEDAAILLFEGIPISAACIEHGSHKDPHECPHTEKLLKKIFS